MLGPRVYIPSSYFAYEGFISNKVIAWPHLGHCQSLCHHANCYAEVGKELKQIEQLVIEVKETCLWPCNHPELIFMWAKPSSKFYLWKLCVAAYALCVTISLHQTFVLYTGTWYIYCAAVRWCHCCVSSINSNCIGLMIITMHAGILWSIYVS